MRDHTNNTALNTQAQNILRENSRDDYTIPTDKLYPFQWNWDSCFCALGWGMFDEPRAWDELHSLFRGQWDNGMLPHIIFHRDAKTYFPGPDVWRSQTTPQTSGISQPPVAASLMRMLFERCQDKDTAQQHINTLIPKIYDYHAWYHGERGHNGLIATYHPWETGRDNSAEWEDALYSVPTDDVEAYHRRDTDLVPKDERPPQKEYDHYIALLQFLRAHQYSGETLKNTIPFKIADLGINAMLLRANRDLIWLLETTDNTALKPQVLEWIATQEAAFEKFWCAEKQAYLSYNLITQKHIPIETSASFLPFYANIVPQDRHDILLQKLDLWKTKVDFLLPSLDPDSSYFDQKRYWRGPVWPIMNFMVATGLQEHGHTHYAEEMRKDTCKLIEEHGFQEYFDPTNGQGLGGDNFSWAAATWLFWAQDL